MLQISSNRRVIHTILINRHTLLLLVKQAMCFGNYGLVGFQKIWYINKGCKYRAAAVYFWLISLFRG